VATPETAASITRQDVIDFYKQWWGPNNATIYIVGDTTLAEITPKLESAFRGWANAPGKRTEVSMVQRATKPTVYLVDRPGALQSVIQVGSVQGKRVIAEDHRRIAFNALFGGNFDSRINMNLREDKGWSYGARTSLGASTRGPNAFVVNAPVQTDQTKGAMAEIRKELTEVVGKRPPSATELNTVRTNTLLGMGSRWESSGAVSASLSDMVVSGLPSDYWDTYAANYRKVTPADVEGMAKKVIPDQNFIWLVVGDRAKIEKGVRELNLGEVVILDANGNPAN
jgi:zinc protease